MNLLEKLSDMIDEELTDADKYIRCAVNYKTENPSLADVFYGLSLDEMKHATTLRQQVSLLMDSHRRQEGEISEGLQTLHDYLHKKHVEREMEVKAMQSIYKG